MVHYLLGINPTECPAAVRVPQILHLPALTKTLCERSHCFMRRFQMRVKAINISCTNVAKALPHDAVSDSPSRNITCEIGLRMAPT